jgi:hypothetical protein
MFFSVRNPSVSTVDRKPYHYGSTPNYLDEIDRPEPLKVAEILYSVVDPLIAKAGELEQSGQANDAVSALKTALDYEQRANDIRDEYLEQQ